MPGAHPTKLLFLTPNLHLDGRNPLSEDLSTLKIDPDSLVKMRPNRLFPAFTIDEPFGPPAIAYYFSLSHIVMLISGNSCGIIHRYLNLVLDHL